MWEAVNPGDQTISHKQLDNHQGMIFFVEMMIMIWDDGIMAISINSREILISSRKIFGNFKENSVKLLSEHFLPGSWKYPFILKYQSIFQKYESMLMKYQALSRKYLSNRMRPCPIIVRAVFAGSMEISIHYQSIDV